MAKFSTDSIEIALDSWWYLSCLKDSRIRWHDAGGIDDCESAVAGCGFPVGDSTVHSTSGKSSRITSMGD